MHFIYIITRTDVVIEEVASAICFTLFVLQWLHFVGAKGKEEKSSEMVGEHVWSMISIIFRK